MSGVEAEVRPRSFPRGGGDAGFAALVVLALAAVLVACGSFAVALGSVAVTRHRAASAADLAALTAAVHAREGTSAACAAARRTAASQHALLRSCWLEGLDAVVEVTAQPGAALDRLGPATGRARAGPGQTVSVPAR